MAWLNNIIGGKGKAIENQNSTTGTIPFYLLQKATKRFGKKRIIGEGAFGNVYYGVLKDGTKVAVKRRKPESKQGEEEFHVEIDLLIRLKHPNLVSLVGYCDEKKEMILAYEYMEKGTLTSHLYGSDKPPLSWEQRLEVCVGAAKGLYFLHTSSPEGIIHRDVKSENILLDEKLCAKVGDFGVCRTGPQENKTHVTTRVFGTFGYLDPEYYQTHQLTVKSDVYSFAGVLLEVLCGRPLIDEKFPPNDEKVSLVSWGKKMLEEERVEEIVDQKIAGTVHPLSLKMFGDIVLKCLAEKRKDRPSMGEVLEDLEQELKCARTGTGSEGIDAAGNLDESEHDVLSSRLTRPRNGKALTRSEGKTYARTSIVTYDPSAPSTSAGYRGSRGYILESILESINEAGNSYGSHHDTMSR